MEEIRVLCDSEITIINLKTGYIYKDEAEAQADKTVDPKDIRRDVKIIVPTIPLFSKTWFKVIAENMSSLMKL